MKQNKIPISLARLVYQPLDGQNYIANAMLIEATTIRGFDRSEGKIVRNCLMYDIMSGYYGVV